MLLTQDFRRALRRVAGVCLVTLASLTAFAQTGQSGDTAGMQANGSGGTVTGTVLDQEGALAVGAKVRLTAAGNPHPQEATSGDNGEFTFNNIPSGAFEITVSAPGFETKSVSGTLNPGQAYIVPAIMLPFARATTNVQVAVSAEEAAQIEVKQLEQQKILGFIPNYFVAYGTNAVPLGPKQKFELAWKSVTAPTTFLGAGMLAGFQQASNDYSGYGQGAAGYGSRFGATYGDVFIGTFIQSAALPSLFKQDPRYFYQGTGSGKSRLLHALSNAIIRKGDDGKYRADYSDLIGAFATAGISNVYYPPSDRGAGLVLQNGLVSIAGGAVAGLFQEFVLPRFTSHSKDHQAKDQP